MSVQANIKVANIQNMTLPSAVYVEAQTCSHQALRHRTVQHGTTAHRVSCIACGCIGGGSRCAAAHRRDTSCGAGDFGRGGCWFGCGSCSSPGARGFDRRSPDHCGCALDRGARRWRGPVHGLVPGRSRTSSLGCPSSGAGLSAVRGEKVGNPVHLQYK